MFERAQVNVYCPSPDCDFRGSVEAERYLSEVEARRCPDCGATPVRVQVPGGPIPRKRPIESPGPGRPKLSLVEPRALPSL